MGSMRYMSQRHITWSGVLLWVRTAHQRGLAAVAVQTMSLVQSIPDRNLAEENEGKKQQSEDRNFVLVDGKGTLKLPEPLEAWAL
jgi:hypothetical protein